MNQGRVVIALLLCASSALSAEPESTRIPDARLVNLAWAVRIPLRDGIRLNATEYLPKDQSAPAPCLFTLTPYISDTYHERGVYFAARGFPFLIVDARGRGNSQGDFRPFLQEARDGHDVVEWLAKQPYCNGKVGMWGGSYAGHDQWVTAGEFPPHLATIVPVASPYMGVDFPFRSNIFWPYLMRWITYTSGRTSQVQIFRDAPELWDEVYRRWITSGQPFRALDRIAGNPSDTFQEWLDHPHPDAYWDRYNPTADDYARISLPILTITGIYDVDQPGALTHYREHMRNASPSAQQKHYLVIGPWDHDGTRTPKAQVGTLGFGAASLVDIPKLHQEWYAWTMNGGTRPAFLQDRVAYYVTGAERWRYAPTLAEVTATLRPLFLGSQANPTDLFHSGTLTAAPADEHSTDGYLYDPADLSAIEAEATVDPARLDRRLRYSALGTQLIYHTEPLPADTEISGFFRLSAWLAIDRPDTDFAVSIYECGADGESVLLTSDALRARYRESSREPRLITTREPLRYDFERFTFVSRQIAKGHRLRLVVSPLHSMYSEKNYNTGGRVSGESLKDARKVTVALYHDSAHPSALYVPVGRDK